MKLNPIDILGMALICVLPVVLLASALVGAVIH